MLIRAGVTFLLGIVLGLRYKVGAILPVAAVLMIFAVADDVAHGRGLWSTILSFVLALVCAEVGYLIGSVIQPFLRDNGLPEENRKAGAAEALSGEPLLPEQNWFEEGSEKNVV